MSVLCWSWVKCIVLNSFPIKILHYFITAIFRKDLLNFLSSLLSRIRYVLEVFLLAIVFEVEEKIFEKLFTHAIASVSI